MSDEDVIKIDPSFFQGLSDAQKRTFEQIIEQNNFLRDSISNVEESATERVAILNAELEDADNTIDKLEAQIANLRVDVSRLQVQNEDLLEVVDTATESAQMSMLREVKVNKDAETVIQEKMAAMDARVSQAEQNIEQKYTSLLYEIQDEKDSLESRLKEVETELKSSLVIIEHKTEANTSLTKQVQQLEETKAELENDLRDLKKQLSSDTITDLKKELKESLEKNTEFKDAVARIKWRSKEEIDRANEKVLELKRELSQMESEQEQVSAELVRVMAERDSLEDEIEEIRLSYDQQELDDEKRNSDISDLDSLGESEAPPSPSPSPSRSRSPRPISVPGTPSFKSQCRTFAVSSPRARTSTPFSLDDAGDNQSQAPVAISMEDHKAKLAEKQALLDDTKRKHFILKEEMENLRRQHTELIENNMLERKNREKLLKAAQKEAATLQKENKHSQKYLASVEKEFSEYLIYHKRQTEIKDATVTVHKELAKSRAANADLARQLVENSKTEAATQQLNIDLQNEVNLLLSEVQSLHNELDSVQNMRDNDSTDDSEDDSDEEEDALFCNSFSQSPRSSTGTQKQNKGKNRPVMRTSSSSSSSSLKSVSDSDYDKLKTLYLANALNSIERQRRESAPSSAHSARSRVPNSESKGNIKIRPRQTNTNLNDHYSPS